MAIGFISRKESFSAAHRLNSKLFSEEENKGLYGKCNHINGHGHNYEVEVVIKGPIDPHSGMIINISDLKSQMKKCLNTLDHKNLDLDIPFFQNNPSTCENVFSFLIIGGNLCLERIVPNLRPQII